MRNEHGKVLSSIRGVGYQVCDDKDMSGEGTKHLERSKRQARVSFKIYTLIDHNNLTPEDQLTVSARMTQAHLVAKAASSRLTRKLASLNPPKEVSQLMEASEALKALDAVLRK
jgi:hypothetical protein